MDIRTPEIEKIIWHWVWKIQKSCGLEAAEIAQELWLEAAVNAPSWDPEKHAALSSYLYPVVQWRAFKLVRDMKRKRKAEALYIQNDNGNAYCSAVEEPTGVLVDRIKAQLNRTSCRVFDVLTDPPEELASLARSNMQVDPSGAPSSAVLNIHVAHLLSIPAMAVSRALKKIRKVLETEAYGDREERRHASS